MANIHGTKYEAHDSSHGLYHVVSHQLQAQGLNILPPISAPIFTASCQLHHLSKAGVMGFEGRRSHSHLSKVEGPRACALGGIGGIFTQQVVLADGHCGIDLKVGYFWVVQSMSAGKNT
jgi:hypothetical protein